MEYLVRLAFIGFEVNVCFETDGECNEQELLEIALEKLKENGFSCHQTSKPIIEWEEL